MTGRFEKIWVAQGFLRELVLIYPVYAIMMGEHGVTPVQLSILFACWSATVVLLEVPSGTIADRFSRKRMLVVSGFIKASGFLCWLLWPEFLGYLAGFVLWSVGATLRSGTAESFLHDSLHDSPHNPPHDSPHDSPHSSPHSSPHRKSQTTLFTRVYGRGKAAEQIGVGVAFVAGGALAEFGYIWPLALAGLGPIASSVLIAVATSEPKRSGSQTAPEADVANPLSEVLRNGLRETRANPKLFAIVCLMSLALPVSGVTDEFVGPFLNEDGSLSLFSIGLAYAAISLGISIGSAFAYRVPSKSLSSSASVLVVASLLLFASVVADGTFVIIMLVSYFTVNAVAEINLGARLQQSISGSSRATITSLAGMGQEVTSITLFLAVGVASDVAWSWGIALLAAILLIVATGFLMVERFASLR